MKANLHTPWSDTVDLISRSSAQGADGFEQISETAHTVFCNWQDGVSQSEFYLSAKYGMRAAAQVEVHKVDLLEAWPRGTVGERFVEFDGVRYKVLRSAAESFDTQTLILTEVIR